MRWGVGVEGHQWLSLRGVGDVGRLQKFYKSDHCTINWRLLSALDGIP